VITAPRPLRRRGLHRTIVDVLGQRIVRGDYAPDQTLPNEAELGNALEVSRTVVREAVKVLASKGLVESRPKIGTRVLPRASWSLVDPDVLSWQVDLAGDVPLFRDLSEIRLMIEPQAAALAAGRRSKVEAAHLLDLVERLEEVSDESERYIPIDLELHSTILQATHNELLARMTGTLSVALAASRRITVKAPGGPRSAMRFHHEVVGAIANQDAEGASRAMQRLITGASSDVQAVLAAREEEVEQE